MSVHHTPLIALKKAIRQALLAEPALIAALGGAHIYDEVPRGVNAPYISFAEARARENGTSSERGHISDMSLHIWSRQGGTQEALALSALCEALLEEAPLTLEGHHLVQLRVVETSLRRFVEKELTRVNLKCRAVSEVIV